MTKKYIGLIGRGTAVWLLIIAAEFLHGAARVMMLEPRVGDFRARQMAVFTGMLIIFAFALLFERRIGAARNFELFLVGLLWIVLTVAFEISLGRALNQSWERIFSDYDVSRGGLLGFGMLLMLFAPMAAAALRNRFARRAAVDF